MQAEYPQTIKDFGVDVIDGDYLHAEHINALRAEVRAIQSALGVALVNTLSAESLLAAGDLITASAPNTLARQAVGINGQVLSADTAESTGLRWVTPTDPFIPRVASITSGATLTPNAELFEQFNITALAVNASVASPTGGAVDGKRLLIRIQDDGTSRTLSWNAMYKPIGVTIPTATTAGKTHYIGMLYNTQASCWDVLAVGTEG